MRTKFSLLMPIFLLIIAGCSTFSLQVPKNGAERYLKCIGNSQGKCDEPAIRPGEDKAEENLTAIRNGYFYDNKGIKFEPISTAPRKNFKNPFSKESKEVDFRLMDKGEMTVDQKDLDLYKEIKFKQSEEVRSFLHGQCRSDADDIFNALWMPNATEITFNASTFNECNNKIAKISDSNGWAAYAEATKLEHDSLLNKALAATAAEKDAAVAEEKAAERDAFRADNLVKYFSAYFRGGKFATVQLSLSDLVSKFPFLAGYPLDVQKQIEDALKKVDSKLKFGRVSDEGFVTRFGAKYAFPPIELQFTPASERFATISKLDYVAIGNDLIRVFIEALFDEVNRLPGVPEATGVKIGRLKSFPDVINTYPHIRQDDFTCMNELANKVESGVTIVVSKVIRGFGLFSINNEAIETLVENVIGVTARKVSEKFTWCLCSCGFQNMLSQQQAEKLAASAGEGTGREGQKNILCFDSASAESRTINVTVYYWGL